MDVMDHRARSFGGLGGRIILLGDGTEINSNDPDADMFDHEDEDHDLEHQVHKSGSSDEEEEEEDGTRKQREGTPGPTSAGEKATDKPTTESPSSVETEKSDGPASADGAIKSLDATMGEKAAEEKKA
jgi:protein phosphatase 2C family protein 2/3